MQQDLNREANRVFRLGRMRDLEITPQKFQPRSTFSAESAAFHKWDIAEGEPVQLTFRASESLARWMQENRPHPTVNVQDTTVTLSVTNPDTFLNWFASLDDAELLDPPWCRTRLRDRLERLRELYG